VRSLVLQKKNFQKPDETQTPPNLRVENIRIGDMTVSKQTYQPGWKWSKHVKPLVKTDSCQVHHFGVWVSGRIRVRGDDGDGWVIGNEPAVFYQFACKPNPK
jgi:hypothetical protein